MPACRGNNLVGTTPYLVILDLTRLVRACVDFKKAVQTRFPIMLLTGEEDCPSEKVFSE